MKIYPYPSQGSLLCIESKNRFETYMIDFLVNKIGFDQCKARCIAEVSSTMYDRTGLYYHTHKHVMYILQNCIVNGIKLEVWEELAILFHDVIYYPGKQNNEVASAMFMKSLLQEFVDFYTMDIACLGVEETAKFMQDDGVNPLLNRILDLDLMGMSSSYEDYMKANDDIRWEFSSIFSKEEFTVGRTKFLKAMLNRKTIFRSQEFACLEEKARNNLSRELKDISNGLY